MKLLNPDEIRSRRDHNKYNIGYDNIFQPDDSTVPHIIVETIVVYRPYPLKELEVSNYITKYLLLNNKSDLIKTYDLTPFKMPVQTIERTFIDKLFAICDYHLQKKYFRYSRHIYDLHMIWISDLIDKKIINDILDEVIKDRQIYGTQNISCKPGMNPSEILNDIITSGAYKDDYNGNTSTFIHQPVEYDICIISLKTILKEKLLPKIIKEY